MAPHPLLNQPAPLLSLPDSEGNPFEFDPAGNGRPTALLFYPQSGSYGCTQQVCQFRDALSEKDVFKSSSINVIGVSPDSVKDQKKFKDKHNLSFPILSDSLGLARKAYSVSRGLGGLTSSSRVTFVIDSKGIVRDSMDATMNYNGHIKFVQKWLDVLEAEGAQTQLATS